MAWTASHCRPRYGPRPLLIAGIIAATNGWGPVERDQSVGCSNANDGKPLTIAGIDVIPTAAWT